MRLNYFSPHSLDICTAFVDCAFMSLAGNTYVQCFLLRWSGDLNSNHSSVSNWLCKKKEKKITENPESSLPLVENEMSNLQPISNICDSVLGSHHPLSILSVGCCGGERSGPIHIGSPFMCKETPLLLIAFPSPSLC